MTEDLLDLIDSCYYPGYYAEAEELCLELLEAQPECQPALMYLSLCLAARGEKAEALEVGLELEAPHILPALRHLAFGSGSPAEAALYRCLLTRGRELGLSSELDQYLRAVERPPDPAEDLVEKARRRLQGRGADLQTTFLLDLKRHNPRFGPDIAHEDDPDWKWVEDDNHSHDFKT